MLPKRLSTTTIIEDISQDQLTPDNNPDDFTDILMDASSQWSEAVEVLGEIDNIQVEPEDLGVQSPPNVVIYGDVVACFVLEADQNKLQLAVAEAILERRSYLVILFSMARLTISNEKDPTGEKNEVIRPTVENISAGIEAFSETDSELSEKILIPSKPQSAIDAVEAYRIRDFWGKEGTADNIQAILERGLRRKKDVTLLN